MKIENKKFNRIKKGIILGFKTSTLPDNILNFINLPLMRIFRVLGGISIIILLSNKLSNNGFSSILFYFVFIISVTFLIYHIIIIYYRILHIIKIWKSDKFDIRNSPIDLLIKHSARLVLCIKGLCDAGPPVATGMAIGLGVDTILQASGRDGIFAPFIAQKLNSLIGNPNQELITLNNLKKQAEEINQDEAAAKALLDSVKDWGKEDMFSKKDAEEMLNILNKHRNDILEQKTSIAKEINKQIGKIDWNKK